MSIKVRYFASLREMMGRVDEQLEWHKPVTVLDVWQLATNNKALPDHILAAVNMEYVKFNYMVGDGDEVAFFPPVTGG